jgi:hyperosmotically inducible periplasmic protein
MNTRHIRKTLLAAGIAASLGLGLAACDPASPPGSQTRALGDSDAMAVSDAAITDQVQARLTTDRDLQAANIDVTTSDGVVTLRGSVSDAAARTAAARAAMSVAGVRSVTNDLTTASSSAASSGSLGGAIAGAQEAISDTWITTKVKADLLADSISQGFDVSVETHDGVVTLEGMLPNQSAIDHVIALTRRVDGVQRVEGSALTAEGG